MWTRPEGLYSWHWLSVTWVTDLVTDLKGHIFSWYVVLAPIIDHRSHLTHLYIIGGLWCIFYSVFSIVYNVYSLTLVHIFSTFRAGWGVSRCYPCFNDADWSALSGDRSISELCWWMQWDKSVITWWVNRTEYVVSDHLMYKCNSKMVWSLDCLSKIFWYILSDVLKMVCTM